MVITAASLLGDCDDEPDEHELPDGDVTSMEMAPVDVQVSPATDNTRQFRLFSWYRHDDSIVPGRTDPQDWRISVPDGNVDGGLVSINQFPTTGAATAEVAVHKSDKPSVGGKALLTLWADPGAAKSKGDVIDATHQPGMPPSVVMLEKKNASGACEWDKPVAFVGAAAVGEQSRNPCSLSLFSADRQMLFLENRNGALWPPNTWPPPGATFPLRPEDRLKIRATVFIAAPTPAVAQASEAAAQQSTQPATAAEIEGVARGDVAWANAIYENNRVGMLIEVQEYKHLLGDPEELSVKVGADPYDCVLPAGLESDPAKPEYAYDSAGVSIYYVSRINFPPDQVGTGVRGIQCHFWYSGNALQESRAKGPIVYISYNRHSTTTLAHEIGHALGLSDQEGRLGTVNLMHNYLPDGPLGADARARLKVGQAFYMNVWNDSWITTRWPQPPQRLCDAASTCPDMGWDAQ